MGGEWTEIQPTAPGWYWRVQSWEGKRISASSTIELCRVDLINGRLLMLTEDVLLYGHDDDVWEELTWGNVTHLWWGPIAPPEAPEVAP